MNVEMQEKFKNLRQRIQALSMVVEIALPAMEEILDGKYELPKNCPSKESGAAMEFGQVRKKLDGLIAAVAEIDEAIWIKREL